MTHADARAVDPLAYIRAVGLAPEDSYGFVPLDLHGASSFVFLYRDRPEYVARRNQLPPATQVGGLDLGPFDIGFGTGRAGDVDVGSEGPMAGLSGILAQAQDLQREYGGMVPAPPDPQQQLQALHGQGVLDDAAFAELSTQVQGGHAGPRPGGAGAAPAPPDAPPIVAHRLYPRISRRSAGEQLGEHLPAYVQALGLASEDVYGVWPRHMRSVDRDLADGTAWDDYWILYRDRPEYVAGRDAWAAEMDEPRGFVARLLRSMTGTWPAPETVAGVAPPGTAAAGGGPVRTDQTGLDDLRRDHPPEDSYGCAPDFNQRQLQVARRG